MKIKQLTTGPATFPKIKSDLLDRLLNEAEKRTANDIVRDKPKLLRFVA